MPLRAGGARAPRETHCQVTAFLPGLPAKLFQCARSPGASMQIHFKFRCRFTIDCNMIIRNYMRMTTIIHNYIHGHQCQGMRRSLRAATGPDPTDR